jgi:hypothetical protein
MPVATHISWPADRAADTLGLKLLGLAALTLRLQDLLRRMNFPP